MARNQLPFEILDEIITQADLYFARPGERDEDSDAVGVRPATRGKGYRPEGFALVMQDERVLYELLAAAGVVEGQHQADGIPGFDVREFARCIQVDSMGRDSIIVYWPDWEITDLPEIYTKD